MAARIFDVRAILHRLSPLALASVASLVFSAGMARPVSAQRDCVSGCIPYAFSIIPATGFGKVAHPMNSTAIDTFAITNSGSLSDTYSLSCSATGTLACVSINPSQPTVPATTEVKVAVTYTVGSTGGRLTLTGTSLNGDTLSPRTATYDVLTVGLVSPATGGRVVVHNRQPIIRAVFEPNLATMDTTATTLTWRGQNVSTLTRANHGLLEWEVDSTHWLNVGDSAQAVVTACVSTGPCASVSEWVVLPNDSAPVLGFAGTPLEALGRVFNTGFGPGLTVSGADVEAGFSTPQYWTMMTPRSAGLVYSTRQSYPRALMPVDLELPWPNGTPTTVHLTLFDGATRLDSLVITSPTCLTGSVHRCRAVLQADFSGGSYSTPTRKWLTVQAQVDSATTTKLSTDSVEVVVVDRRSTMYGSGWWPTGVLKLVAAGTDRVVVAPNGSSDVFRGNGDSVYISPPGNFTGLKRSGTGWILFPRGSTAHLVFDNLGRLTQSVDSNANTTTIAYSGTTDQVTSITDPMSKVITFGYNAAGKLTSLTDPASRVTRDSIDTGNRLIYDSTASPSSSPAATTFVYQSYPGTNTYALLKRIGVISDTTVVAYDSTFKRRPSQVTLPQVWDENGTAVRPVIGYSAYERQGYGALLSLNNVTVQVTDPRGNWTRSLLNRWGLARTVFDTLGTMRRTYYTPEGLVQWTEGKVADSSRVYTAYDTWLRPTKHYIVRAATDTFRLDSLVYDANHRVIRRIGQSNDTSWFAYDASGNLTQSITATHDTTRVTYLSNGMPATLRLPGNTSSRSFAYDG